MAQNVSKVPFTEKNNHPQGRSGSGTKKFKGPAVGTPGMSGKNSTTSGGVFRATSGRKGKM